MTKFTHGRAGCQDAEWKGRWGEVAAGVIFTWGFVVVKKESLETEEKCEIGLGRWANEGILSQTCQ